MEIVGDLVGPPASEAAWNATLREWDDLNATRVGTGRRRTRRRR